MYNSATDDSVYAQENRETQYWSSLIVTLQVSMKIRRPDWDEQGLRDICDIYIYLHEDGTR